MGSSAKEVQGAVLLVGLGRFGAATARQLMKQGREVLVIEKNLDLVEKYASQYTHVVQADASNIDALAQLDASDFKCAVVGVGTSIEASVLITANLVDLGIPMIWAKAITPSHGKILERIGAHHVVYPEADAGQRVAHLLSGNLLDFIEFNDGFSIAKMYPPREVVGRPFAESQVRTKFGVTVVGIKRPGEEFEFADERTVVDENDVMIVSGTVEQIEYFAARP